VTVAKNEHVSEVKARIVCSSQTQNAARPHPAEGVQELHIDEMRSVQFLVRR